ncbi:MAG: hypothetical protein RL434_1625 [Pseudomonadota bacterium]
MSMIEVSHLPKEFHLGALTSLRRSLANAARRLSGKTVEERPAFKALDDVSFSVERGEVIGIIGHNGAGKSTLLKILSGISDPTGGSVKVNGRIAPLIEVGAGFVPDFTGRENVYLNGAILGMSRAEIDSKFDQIVEFSEIGEFIDTPVKRYSSGMQVKLAFSVATAVESEILIVDEVLAVGDVAFQRKCLDRMENLINSEGRTVLIVGHGIRQLERICSRMILLRHGQIVIDGEPGAVSKLFLDETTLKSAENALAAGPQPLRPYKDSKVMEVTSLEIVGERKVMDATVCPLMSDLHIRLTINALHPIRNAEIQIGLHSPEMVFMTKSSTLTLPDPLNLEPGINHIELVVEKLAFCPGTYGVGVTVFDWARNKIWAGNKLRWVLVESTAEQAAKLPNGTLAYLPSHWEIARGEAP